MKSKFTTILVSVLAVAMMLSACNTAAPAETTASETETSASATEATETSAKETEDPLVIKEDFKSEEQKWRVNGDCKIEVNDGKAVITERKTNNAGIELPIDAFRGNKVHAEASVKSGNDSITLSLRYNIFGNTSYVNIAFLKPDEDIIMGVGGDISIPENATDIVIYVEANDVKDIIVSSMSAKVVGDYNDLTNTPVAELKDPSSYESLAEAYKEYFKIGAAVPATVMTNTNDQFRTLVTREFNSVTCENDLKPENVLDTEANLADPAKYNESPAINFDAAKPTLDFCKENGLQMRGHTLIWHSQTPSWFFYKDYNVNGELADRELMLKRMENYIDSVMNWCSRWQAGKLRLQGICRLEHLRNPDL